MEAGKNAGKQKKKMKNVGGKFSTIEKNSETNS